MKKEKLLEVSAVVGQMAWRPALVGGVAALLLVRQLVLTIRKKKAELDQNEDEVDYNYLTVAAKEAEVAMQKEEGGPFGAVIVRNGEIVAQAHNEVLKQKDPTAHAEILAIQKVLLSQCACCFFKCTTDFHNAISYIILCKIGED